MKKYIYIIRFEEFFNIRRKNKSLLTYLSSQAFLKAFIVFYLFCNYFLVHIH